MNLRYKQKGVNTEVERISSRIQKDMYSALLYGLFWVYLEEMKNMKHCRKSNVNISDLLNYIPPTIRKRRF